MNKRTVLIGASEKADRYAFRAINKLREAGHSVHALALKPGQVNDVVFKTGQPIIKDDIDTVTLYVGPANQKAYYDYILSLKPKRVIFNPGTENPEFKELLEAQGINTLEACTLVLLTTKQY